MLTEKNIDLLASFSSSSYSAYGFQDHDPNKGFPVEVKQDINSSGTLSNVTSIQSITIMVSTSSVLPNHILSVTVFVLLLLLLFENVTRTIHFFLFLEQDEYIWPIETF